MSAQRWTSEDYVKARRMWADGKTATEIGVDLGRSRNSVLGLADRHRSDFPKRLDPNRQKKAAKPWPATPKTRKPTIARPSFGEGGRVKPPGAADSPRHPAAPADAAPAQRRVTASRRASDVNTARPFPLRDDPGSQSGAGGLPLRAAPVPFSDVASGCCRWPLDLDVFSPATADMMVCGAPVAHAGSARAMARTHCAYHLAKAGQNPVRRLR